MDLPIKSPTETRERGKGQKPRGMSGEFLLRRTIRGHRKTPKVLLSLTTKLVCSFRIIGLVRFRLVGLVCFFNREGNYLPSFLHP